jgi:quercetin dioxygenase-like cupin family protein
MDALQVTTLNNLPAFQLTDTVWARPLFGQEVMFNFLEFEPGGLVPLHHHPHEQLGLILGGELLMISGGTPYVLHEDAVYALPGGTPHEGRAGPEGCRVLDVFHPIREDYRARFRAAG